MLGGCGSPPWWGLGGLPGSQLLPVSAAHQHSPSYICPVFLKSVQARRLRGRSQKITASQEPIPAHTQPSSTLRALPVGFRWFLGPSSSRRWVILKALSRISCLATFPLKQLAKKGSVTKFSWNSWFTIIPSLQRIPFSDVGFSDNACT